MSSIRAVVEYTGLSIHEALALPCDLFMLCRKNWIIEQMMRTEEGRSYLDDCRRYEKTELDKAGLARLMERMG